ncbi:MAG: HAMP domain-containing protein, partial [Leptospiraceae bacterium]|nr:HAMP domain-containing protein [Leptospiraceae bacterium]
MGTPEKPIGVAGIGIDITKASQEFSALDMYGGGSWLIDTKGIIKISKNPLEIGKFFDVCLKRKEKQNLVLHDKKPNAMLYIQENEKLSFIAYTTLKDVDWKVLYKVDYDSITNSLVLIKYTTLFSGVLFVVLVICAFHFLSKSFTNPIKELTTVAKQIANGNFQMRYHTSLRNEIGSLSKSFNFMAESLVGFNNDLRESNRNLEEKVKDRTKDLIQQIKVIEELNYFQNGDYYLISLLVEPFAKNDADSTKIKIESFLKQKK